MLTRSGDHFVFPLRPFDVAQGMLLRKKSSFVTGALRSVEGCLRGENSLLVAVLPRWAFVVKTLFWSPP